ncbi:putative ribonuclease H-like domain-containing protein [Tanacetum coccineum]
MSPETMVHQCPLKDLTILMHKADPSIENLIDLRVKVIRCDNGTKLKNRHESVLEMKGRKPALNFMRPFGCPVTILNIIDRLGKFNGKADEGFFVAYSTNSKAFRVFNSRTRIVEETSCQFSENTPNIGRKWTQLGLFNIDALYKIYEPIEPVAAEKSSMVSTVSILDLPFSSSSKDSPDDGFKPSREEEKKDAEIREI